MKPPQLNLVITKRPDGTGFRDTAWNRKPTPEDLSLGEEIGHLFRYSVTIEAIREGHVIQGFKLHEEFKPSPRLL